MTEKAILVSVDREVAGYSLKAGEDNFVPESLARHLVTSRKATYAPEKEEQTPRPPIEAVATVEHPSTDETK